MLYVDLPISLLTIQYIFILHLIIIPIYEAWTLDPCLYTLRPTQNDRHFLDDNFKCILLNKNASISINISLKFVTNVPINNFPAMVQMMAWRRPGDKPLSETMLAYVTDAYTGRSASVNERVKLGNETMVNSACFITFAQNNQSWSHLLLEIPQLLGRTLNLLVSCLVSSLICALYIKRITFKFPSFGHWTGDVWFICDISYS